MFLVLDGADAVAAEFMVAGKSSRSEDDIRADGAKDVVLKFGLHDDDKMGL